MVDIDEDTVAQFGLFLAANSVMRSANASKRSPEKFLSLISSRSVVNTTTERVYPISRSRLMQRLPNPRLPNTYVRFPVGSLYKRTAEYLIADSDFCNRVASSSGLYWFPGSH